MKKFAAVILLLLYFLLSTGFVLSVHYCMDEVDSVALGDASGEDCSKCGMPLKDNDGCCKNEVKVVKVQADQLVGNSRTADFTLLLPVLHATPSLFTFSFNTAQLVTPRVHGPPLSKQDTYLQNRVFRI